MSEPFTPTRVRLAERLGFGLYVLIAVALVVRQIGGKIAGGAPSSSAPTLTATVATTAQPSTAAPTIAPKPQPTATAAPTQSPLATPGAAVVTAYQNGGRRFAGLAVPVGTTLASPIAGTVGVVVYQFLGGEVRVGSNVPSEPFFPYVTITSADRKVILRPGALNQDVQLLVKDGAAVSVGSPLFSTLNNGASSWRTFYDRSVTAQVIASVAALPSGAELDPVTLFTR